MDGLNGDDDVRELLFPGKISLLPVPTVLAGISEGAGTITGTDAPSVPAQEETLALTAVRVLVLVDQNTNLNFRSNLNEDNLMI